MKATKQKMTPVLTHDRISRTRHTNRIFIFIVITMGTRRKRFDGYYSQYHPGHAALDRTIVVERDSFNRCLFPCSSDYGTSNFAMWARMNEDSPVLDRSPTGEAVWL